MTVRACVRVSEPLLPPGMLGAVSGRSAGVLRVAVGTAKASLTPGHIVRLCVPVLGIKFVQH